MVEVTRRQMDALNFIKQFIATHNTVPPLKTIAHGIKTSPSSMQRIMKKLIESGVIERDYYARDYHIVGEARLKSGKGVN